MPEVSWGESVTVKAEASEVMRPGAIGAVCGIREIENEAQAREFGAPIGSKVYLVEFNDGASIEIPEVWIEATSA